MSDKLTLTAEKRTEFGKGAARRARAAHQTPAVIYGHGTEPVHIVLPAHDTMLALKHSNALLTIKLEDDSLVAIVKDVQRDPVRRLIEHVDLQLVNKGEKITVDVPLHIVGESFPGTIHVTEYSSLQLEADATNLPDGLDLSIEGLTEGTKVHASDVPLPDGATLVTDPDAVVVTVLAPRGGSGDDADESGAESAAE